MARQDRLNGCGPAEAGYMKHRTKLERLEVRVDPKKPKLIRSGYLKTLPADYAT
jgi:hypothetical protein